MSDTVFKSDAVAVVTGGAAGIGLAIAKEFASRGMTIVVVDNRPDHFSEAEATLRGAGATDVMTSATDVSDLQQVIALERAVADRFGGTDVLVNNAGIQPGSAMFGPMEAWRAVLETNLWGIIHGTHSFAPRMIDRGRPGMIINTGSKQGITTPPGDPAYNVAKAGVKAYTEALAYDLRNTEGSKITAHLLIPGFVFTELTASGRSEKPEGAWTHPLPGQ
jgi:NAD(P)-dependent dehydrogenase (short-subunit alcohol dehydrogenase family)